MDRAGEAKLDVYVLKSPTKGLVGLSGQLTSETLSRLSGLLPKLDYPRIVEVDVSDLTVIDDDGLQALKFFERRCNGRGILLVIGHPRPYVRRQLNRAGIAGLLAPSFPRRRVTRIHALPPQVS